MGVGEFYLPRQVGAVGQGAVHALDEAGKARAGKGEGRGEHAQVVAVSFGDIYARLRPYEYDFFKFPPQLVYGAGGGGVASQHYRLGAFRHKAHRGCAHYLRDFLRALVAVRAVGGIGEV